jgi:hypothetical protein
VFAIIARLWGHVTRGYPFGGGVISLRIVRLRQADTFTRDKAARIVAVAEQRFPEWHPWLGAR